MAIWRISLTIVLFFIPISKAFSATWFVDIDVVSSGNGTSWQTAVKIIQEAIDKASDNDEIWVKKGVYLPNKIINVEKSVKILGGFNGTETAR